MTELQKAQGSTPQGDAAQSPPKPGRRWLQFSLRSLMLFVAVCCVVLSWWMSKIEPARRRARAAETLRRLGADVVTNSNGTVIEVSLCEAPPNTANLNCLGELVYLERLTLTGPSMTDDVARRIGRAKRLKSLCLWDTALTDAGVEHLGRMEGLEDVHFEGQALTNAGVAHLGRLPRLTRLVVANTSATESVLADWGPLPYLNELRIDFPITDDGAAQLARFEAITELEFSDACLSKRGFSDLARLPILSSLKVANIRPPEDGAVCVDRLQRLDALYLCGQETDDDTLGRIVWPKGLTVLGLSGTSVTDAGLVHIRDATGLTAVILEGCDVTVAGLAPLCESPRLERLYLEGTKVAWKDLVRVHGVAIHAIGDASVLLWGTDGDHLVNVSLPDRLTEADLAYIEGLPNVEEVSLATTLPTDAWISALATLPKLRKVRFDAAVNLAQLAALSNLEDIAIGCCMGIPEEGLRKMLAMPRLRSLSLVGADLSYCDMEQIQHDYPSCEFTVDYGSPYSCESSCLIVSRPE